MPTPPLFTRSSDRLALSVFADGTMTVRDLSAGGETWTTWPAAVQEDNEIDAGHVWLRTGRSLCEQYPGRFRAVSHDAGEGRVRLEVVGRAGAVVGQFTATFAVHADSATVTVTEVTESLPSLSYPPAFDGAAALLLPNGPGKLITQPSDDRRFYTFWAHLNMRMWGHLRGDPQSGPGLLATFDAGHADAGLHLTKLLASPAWLKSLGAWSTSPRTVRYRLTSGGYVGLARAYREHAASRGLLVTLTEKLARRPQLAPLLKGRIVSFMLGRTLHPDRAADAFRPPPAGRPGLQVDLTYADARRTLDLLRSAGVASALVQLRGWIRGGYDETHPDLWPPEPAFGPLEELKDFCALTGDYTVSLHDNYQDIYAHCPSFPGGVIRTRDGSLMPGGYWAGGQAYILNARDSLEYLRRNWKHIRTLAPRAIFPDTTTAVQLYQSFEPGNTCTRAQDEQYKLDLLAFLDAQGCLVGSEESSEFAMPVVSWLENRHKRVAGESVPLWSLVYHDCVANGRYGNAYYADPSPSHVWAGGADPSRILHRPEGAAPPWATELLWGYFVLMSLGTWGDRADDKLLAAAKSTLHLDAHFARLATAAMTAHRYLTPDGQVERTEFSTGTAVTVNFSAEPYQGEGTSLPPGGWKVEA